MDKRINNKTTNNDELLTNLDFINTHWDIQSTTLKNKIPLKQGFFSKIQNLFNSRLIGRIDSIADKQAIFNSFVSQTLNQLTDQISQKKVTQRLNQFNDQIAQNSEKHSREIKDLSDKIITMEHELNGKNNQFSQEIQSLNKRYSEAISTLDHRTDAVEITEQANLDNLCQRIREIDNQINSLVRSINEIDSSVKDRYSEAISTLQHRTDAVEITERANLDNLCQRLLEVDSQFNNLVRRINGIDSYLKPTISTNPAGRPIPIKKRFNYFEFEEVFRGSEELIKERQRQYLPYFKGKEKVIDLGSGRGEFLALLNEEGIQGIGVDCDQDMVLRSREKGLVIVKQDILEYLEFVPDESLDGIFSAQVIEHLPFEKLDLFFNRSFAKLKNGGILVVETVNPYNLSAFRFFYLDPTHQQPLFPELISYMCRVSGFNAIEIKYIPPDQRAQQTNVSDPDDQWACGDYAVIAKKLEYQE